jgi:leucyl/phenylalanyl-tRNA---protein transferase
LIAPPQRGILLVDEFHVPRSLRKDVKGRGWTVTVNQRFTEVVEKCANARNRHDGNTTWITQGVIEGYLELHHLGFAYSIETCDENNQLIGGLYGVNINGYIGGESMFYSSAGASKCALMALISTLKEQGIPWLDCQMVTDVLGHFGAKYLERKDFVALLAQQLTKEKPKLTSDLVFLVDDLL